MDLAVAGDDPQKCASLYKELLQKVTTVERSQQRFAGLTLRAPNGDRGAPAAPK